MKTFLEKLERKAEQWVNTMDDQLQDTSIRVMTGEVFTHGTATDEVTLKTFTPTEETPATNLPQRPDLVVNSMVRPLQKANAAR